MSQVDVPLDEQIVATLTAACTSEQAGAVLRSAQAAMSDLSSEADAADVASLSPLATATEAAAHRQRAGDLRFEADRMEASVAALEGRVADLRDAERADRILAARAAVIADRDALAAEIARDYPRLVRELTVLAKRIHESDVACKAVGVPESAEAIGRGLGSFSTPAGWIMRLTEGRIGMPASTWSAWEETAAGWQWRGLTIPEGPNLPENANG